MGRLLSSLFQIYLTFPKSRKGAEGTFFSTQKGAERTLFNVYENFSQNRRRTQKGLFTDLAAGHDRAADRPAVHRLALHLRRSPRGHYAIIAALALIFFYLPSVLPCTRFLLRGGVWNTQKLNALKTLFSCVIRKAAK